MSNRHCVVAFAGTFAASLMAPVRFLLDEPCDIFYATEADVAARLADVDVLVSLGFSREMGAAARVLKIVQVPGAGLDRINRSALPAGVWLAHAYGPGTGIAEYAMGAMLTLALGLGRLDAALRHGRWESQWAVGRRRPRPGRSSRVRRSASSATGGSARPRHGAPAHSTCRCGRRGGMLPRRKRTTWRSSAAPRRSTRSCGTRTTSR